MLHQRVGTHATGHFWKDIPRFTRFGDLQDLISLIIKDFQRVYFPNQLWLGIARGFSSETSWCLISGVK
jgi:hypothetical protein